MGKLGVLKRRARKLLDDGAVAGHIEPKPREVERSAGRLVRLPRGPSDMVDPRSVSVEKWIDGLAISERLAVQFALSFFYPCLAHDPVWQSRIDRDRERLGPDDLTYTEIMRMAAEIVSALAEAYRKAAADAGIAA